MVGQAGSLEILLLGPVEVWAGGRRLRSGPPKRRAVLAALAVDAGRPVPPETLIERVWGDRPPAQVRAAVHTNVTLIRRMLDEVQAYDAVVLPLRPGGYVLQVDPLQVDLNRFRGLALAARDPHRTGPERVGLLREALDQWRGRALADLTGEWPARMRDSWDMERLDATVDWARTELQLGHHEQMITALRALVADYPLAEPLVVVLMQALVAAGRVAEALDCYAITRTRLVRELGADPGTELQELHAAILRGEVDLSRSVPAARVGPAQLPREAGGFTGRRGELAQLDAVLAAETDAVAISVVSGTAGVGKTALALHWAHQVRDRFPDGQLFVDLRGYAPVAPVSAIEALAGFLRALGVPAEQVPVDVDQAAGLYRSLLADRRMLIVLDNARTAEQVRPLLPGSGDSMVLVTSRDELGGLVACDGAHRISLDVLSPDEARHVLARILGEDRVHAEPDATARLAEACAFLPLALRICAAALVTDPQRTVADQVAGLTAGNRLDGLAMDGDEHTGVRATFDLSYASMTPEAQRLFRLLGLVPGPDFTAAAAGSLLGASDRQAVRLLDRLTGAHLLSRHAPGRFTFHDLLRAYAVDQVQQETSAAERAAATQRLLDWYLYTVDAAARLVYPTNLRLPVPEAEEREAPAFDDYGQALAWLDAERRNLVAAIVHAAEHGPRRTAWRLVDALRSYFWLRMDTLDWMVAATAALSAAEADGDDAGRAAAHVCLADAYRCQSRLPAAIDHYSQALTLLQRSGSPARQAACLNLLGNASRESARLAEAVDYYEQALAINRRIGREVGEANTLTNLATVYHEQGRLELAADHHAKALALNRRTGPAGREAIKLGNLAEVHHALGQLDRARDDLLRAVAVHRELDDHAAQSGHLRSLAEVHRDAGRLGDAYEAARTALTLARDIGDRRFEADALNTLASVYQCLGDHRRAIEHHRLALDLAHAIDSRCPEVVALIGLATAQQGAGQPEQARASAEQAVALARRAGYRVYEGQALTALADLYCSLDEPETALGYARRALEIHRDTAHRLGQARTLLVLGHALRHTDGDVAAVKPWQEALALFTDIGAPEAHLIRTLLDSRAPC